MLMINERVLEFNARWLKDYLDQVGDIEHYEILRHEQHLTIDELEFVTTEIIERKKELEQYKNIIRNFKDYLSQILYLKYVEGYSLEKVADQMKISRGYAAKLHSAFTRHLRKRANNERDTMQ
ncbi:DUF1492 domain-containing protein [Lysinibacillus fusiformis]|uniref:DUF1492 domain-containing protein n=1 Tax=Lysinibacillus fusiformis TaxID=28031 RepID=UPI0015968298|nr:DUF1492 domain-containing protein [Lysinibacillus fusiformis]